MSKGVVLFHNTSSALRAEKVLKKAGIGVKLAPTPRELSSDCGIALRFENALGSEIGHLLAAHGVEIEALHYPFPKVV